MAVQKEYWRNKIEEVLTQSNSFLAYATNLSEYFDGKTVHIPNSGELPTITRNPSSWPLTATKRTDSDKTFNMDAYATNLIHIEDVEDIQASYAKTESVIGGTSRRIADSIGNNTLILWTPSATTQGVIRILRTTGASGTTLCTTATGVRKRLCADDILAAKGILDQDLVPAEGRKMVIPSALLNELLAIPDFVRADAYGMSNIASGSIGRIYGMDVIERANALVLTSGATPALVTYNDGGQFTGNTVSSCYGVLCYHPDFVAIAKGPTKIYAENERADFQGAIISGKVLHGASLMRNQSQGVAVIAQAFVNA